MAIGGNFLSSGWYSSAGKDYVYLEFAWEVTSTSIENNTKTIYWELRGKREYTGYIMAGAFKVVIDGETVYSKGKDYRIQLRKGTVVATGTKTITHNPDGTRSFSVSIQGALYDSNVNVTGSQTFQLDPIPKASTISCTTANVESNPVITINKSVSSYTHTIDYQFGNLSGNIATKTSAASITNWTIPSSFYAQIPNSKTGEGILICTTYNGNTVVGDPQTCKLSVTTDEAKCKPDVSGAVVDVNETTVALTGNSNKLIRHFSTARCTITAKLNKEAGSISLMTVNNTAIPANKNYVDVENVETGVFDFYAKDSRGYYNSDKESKDLILYEKLTCNVTGQRTDPTSGKVKLTIEGNYFNGSLGAVSNELTLTYKIGKGMVTDWIPTADCVPITPTITGNTYKVDLTITDLDYTKAFPIMVFATDKLMTTTKKLPIQKGIPVFDWGENDFNFNVPVTIQGNTISCIAEQGQVEDWTYRKWSDGILELWCNSTAEFENGYVLASEELVYPFVMTNAICGIGTVNSYGGNSADALPWNAKLAYGSDRCRIWVHDSSGGFTEESSVETSIYLLGRWNLPQ